MNGIAESDTTERLSLHFNASLPIALKIGKRESELTGKNNL